MNKAWILVADIGGTNGRFALVPAEVNGNLYEPMLVASGGHLENKPMCQQALTLASKSAPSVLALVQQYLALIPTDFKIIGASLALAGPVINQQVHLINLGWSACASQLSAALNMPVLLLNDFVAYANSVPALDPKQLLTVRAGEAVTSAPILVLGPGTGFGAAVLHPMKQRYVPVGCEAGHICLAATNAEQDALLLHARRQVSVVNVEYFLSGPGLVRLYQAMAELMLREAQSGETPINAIPASLLDSPAAITEAALAGNSVLTIRTLRCFCYWLGQVVSDLVLAHGALGGVVLCGGILPKIVPLIMQGEFINGVMAKDDVRHYLQPVPIQLALNSDTALIGAALWWQQHQLE
ncbi:MAG: glucokinase [Shewanella sp.]